MFIREEQADHAKNHKKKSFIMLKVLILIMEAVSDFLCRKITFMIEAGGGEKMNNGRRTK